PVSSPLLFDYPKIHSNKILANIEKVNASIGEGIIRAAATRVFRHSRMAALIHLGHVVADTLQKVHVEMTVLRRVAPFFTKHNGFTRFLDPALRHGLVNDRVEAEVAAHLRFEIVLPP